MYLPDNVIIERAHNTGYTTMTIEQHILNILVTEGKDPAFVELYAMQADGFLSDSAFTRLYNLLRWY